MISVDIYSLLSSKPNYNEHHLKRYVKFIQTRKPHDSSAWTEGHHILPKADDMFPEYSDLNAYPWNKAILSGREHILAHVMLWLAFPESKSCTAAVYYMFNVQRADLNYKLSGRIVPIVLDIKFRARIREEYFKSREGYGSYKNGEGDIFFLHRDDPRIKDECLVGHMKGFKMSSADKEKMSRSKDCIRVARIRFLEFSTNVPYQSELFDEYLSQGWTVGLSDDDREFNKSGNYEAVSSKLKGRADYMFPDGTFAGKLYPDDPRIHAEGLAFHKTESSHAAVLENQKKAVEANLGTLWYNDGKINKKFRDHPGDPWVIGQLISSETKAARKEATSKAIKGKTTYNDGIRNFFVGPADFIDPSWIKGMKPQKKRNFSPEQSGYAVYNDGVSLHRVRPGETPAPSWVKGMLPR